MRKKSGIMGMVLWVLVLAGSVAAQGGTSVYFKNFVRHSDGNFCLHTPPEASFTVYLNGDESAVLTESAPRWDSGGDPNIAGTGVFGVELGNFTAPSLAVGDSVFVRFTCAASGEQAVLADSVTMMPWVRPPGNLNLSAVNFPQRPENVSITRESNGDRIVSWSGGTGLTYRLYRRTVQDTVPTGGSRMLYRQVADNLTEQSFTDTNTSTDSLYGYIVYAVNAEGLFSPHSEDVQESDGIQGLTVTATATNAKLSWQAYQTPIGNTAGYNIYRRTENGSFGDPIAFTGSETHYIDSRLETGTTYYYKVSARVDAQTEFGLSPEVPVTTLASQDGYYTYANFKIAVIIYQNTNASYHISDDEVADIKRLMEYLRTFYWRNSSMKLNLELTYYVISDYKDFGSQGSWASMLTTVDHLKNMGFMNTQYDQIFRITPATDGYWSYGAPELSFPGPSRRTGFCQVHWPINSGVGYPGVVPNINIFPGLIWTGTHENQHSIDAIYKFNGHEEMPHGDFPERFGPENRHGRRYDFQGKMLRFFDAYEDLLPEWGDIYEAVDADQDGMPDDEPMVPFDEVRFGSSNLLQDTDSDGLWDRDEAIVGLYDYSTSNPNNPDTDNDGQLDGDDIHPMYPIDVNIQQYKPTIDGTVEPEWPLVNEGVLWTSSSSDYNPKLYMSYDADSLYLALYLPHVGIPEITFDFGADGWWYGRGNLVTQVNPSTGDFMTFRCWDGSPEARALNDSLGGKPDGMWDDNVNYMQHFGTRVFYPGMVNLSVNLTFPKIQIEMAIPRRELAELNLQPGDSVGIRIDYDKVNNEPGKIATTFDQWSYVYVVLDGASSIERPGDLTGLPKEFVLERNYPNPFNPETRLAYRLPRNSDIELSVFNLLGQKVRTLVKGTQAAGRHEIVWNGRDEYGTPVSSGIYFYMLKTADGRKLIRKMTLLK